MLLNYKVNIYTYFDDTAKVLSALTLRVVITKHPVLSRFKF